MFIVLMNSSFIYAMGGAISWSKIYNGYGNGYSIQQTADLGFIAAGFIGGNDLWVLKLDSFGETEWQKSFPGIDSDSAVSVQQTSSGGYILAGYTYSYGAGGPDGWVILLDSSGSTVWQKTLGGSGFDFFNSVRETSGGGFILCGDTNSFSAHNAAWIVRLDASGNLQWQKIIQGTSYVTGKSVEQTQDGGFILGGSADIGLNTEFWLAKLDSSGSILWQKAYGGNDPFDNFLSMQLTQDGGFVLAGATQSFGAGYFDVWVLRLDSAGSIQWEKSYGTAELENSNSIVATLDGGFLLSGVQSNPGNDWDGLVMKLDSLGNIQWQKNYGGPNQDLIYEADQVQGGGYIMTGRYGGANLWLLKIDSSGILSACNFTRDASVTTTNTSATVTTTAFVSSVPQVAPIASTSVAANTTGIALLLCGNIPFCHYKDDFEDGTVDLVNWTILKPSFIEILGDFVGTPTGRKAMAVSSGFTTCQNRYRFQTTMQSDGGPTSKLWLFGWFQDKKNNVQLLMNEKTDKWILKVRSNGRTIAKSKAFRQIDPNVRYDVAMRFDGTFFTVFIDFVQVISLQSPIQPDGIMGYQVKSTSGRFSNVCLVEESDETCFNK
jgi:hypothetical protein